MLRDVETGEVLDYADQPGHRPLKEGLEKLSGAEAAIGHNVCKYDLPALEKIYPGWQRPAKVIDTLILARLAFPRLKEQEFAKQAKGKLQDGIIPGSQALKAWGIRLGCLKGDFGKGHQDQSAWEAWTPEMHEYCIQDTAVTDTLYRHLRSEAPKRLTQKAVDLEHEITRICALMERNGFPFDVEGANRFYGELSVAHAEAEQRLQDALGLIFVKTGQTFTPKRDDPRKGFVAGATMTKVRCQPISPSSRPQLIRVLTKRYGWRPKDFTPAGQPKLDDTIIDTIPLPENLRKSLKDYLVIEKVKSFLASKNGKKGWLHLERNGRIHAEYNAQGTDTGRASHSNPNIAQVPSVVTRKVMVNGEEEEHPVFGIDGDFGADCRRLFTAAPGFVLIGSDLQGLELRMLADFVYEADGGEYANVVLTGGDCGDVHVYNQRAAGLPTRNAAKTFIYAWLYGAGDYKIGTIVGVSPEETDALLKKYPGKIQRLIERLSDDLGRPPTRQEVATALKGGEIKARFMRSMPALVQRKEELIRFSRGFRKMPKAPGTREMAAPDFDEKWWRDKRGQWWAKVAPKGYIRGLDGRWVAIKSEHSALNYHLQGGGALVCKRWVIQLYHDLQSAGFDDVKDFQLHLWCHDEVQVSARPEIADAVAQIVKQAAPKAGAFFNLNVPIEAATKIGRNWMETH